MRKRAFVERFKEIGTQPFGVDRSNVYAANEYFDRMDREVESQPGALPRKFGVISFHEKLAALREKEEYEMQKVAALHRIMGR